MSRFFFHVHDDHDAFDQDGIEFPDAAAAEREAVRSARSLACDQVSKGRLNLSHFIEVTDAGGNLLSTVALGDAIELTR